MALAVGAQQPAQLLWPWHLSLCPIKALLSFVLSPVWLWLPSAESTNLPGPTSSSSDLLISWNLWFPVLSICVMISLSLPFLLALFWAGLSDFDL